MLPKVFTSKTLFTATATAFAAIATAIATFAVAATAATATSAIATTAASHLAHVLDFVLLGCFSHLFDLSLEMQVHSREGMVDVADHFLSGNLLDCGGDDVAILVLEGYLCTFLHHVGEELARLGVGEKVLGQGDDLLVIVFSICFGRGEGEVETVALLLAFDILLKTWDQLSYSKDKLKRLTRTGLLDIFNFWCFVGILRSFVA